MTEPRPRAFADWSAERWITVLAWLGIVVIVGTVREPLKYDEVPYLLDSVTLLDRVGFTRQFFLEYPQPAGLLFGVLHWWLRPLTHLEPTLVRLVNPVLFLGVVVLTQAIAARLRVERPGDAAWSMMGVPFLWVLTGLALTEMISIFCAVAAAWGLMVAVSPESRPEPQRLAFGLAGGLMLGIGFYSRPPILVLASAAPALLVGRPNRWPQVAGFWAGVALAIAPALYLWHGLVPPEVEVYSNEAFSIVNLLLSLGYAAVAMWMVGVGWYRLSWPAAAALVAAAMAINWVTGAIATVPLQTLTSGLLPAEFRDAFGLLAGGLLAGLGLVFAVATLRNIWDNRYDPDYLFVALGLLLLVASTGKITHRYSSRYTGLAAPLIALAGARSSAPAPARRLRLATGVGFGVVSLASYLFFS